MINANNVIVLCVTVMLYPKKTPWPPHDSQTYCSVISLHILYRFNNKMQCNQMSILFYIFSISSHLPFPSPGLVECKITSVTGKAKRLFASSEPKIDLRNTARHESCANKRQRRQRLIYCGEQPPPTKDSGEILNNRPDPHGINKEVGNCSICLPVTTGQC